MTAPKMPQRSAEEIAREMVPDAWTIIEDDGSIAYRSAIEAPGGHVPIRLGAYADDAADGVNVARVILARLIEQARADGAAAALAEDDDAAADARIELMDLQGRVDMATDYVVDARAALASGDIAAAEERIARAARAFLRLQGERDLSGRIRALVQEYAGRWADTSGEEAAAHRDVMKHMRVALKAARAGDDISVYVENLREDDDYPKAYIGIFRGAADELEAIVRECAEEAR